MTKKEVKTGKNKIKKHPYFSVIMPSFLTNFSGSAKNRDKGFSRAVGSVINQTFPGWELLIIADGCQKTVELAKAINEHYEQKINGRLKGFYIDKCPRWSGTQRNTGILEATGEYIIYLDSDDFYGDDYLQDVYNAIQANPGHPFYYVDDKIWKGEWVTRNAIMGQLSRCGTSNLIHKDRVLWTIENTYAHDFKFIKKIIEKVGLPIYLPGVSGYHVCHIPSSYDV
jgi:glycosyltransferase involved in cell wall biosynthesis